MSNAIGCSFRGESLVLRALAMITLVSAILLPPFTISENLPKVELSDVLVFPIGVIVVRRCIRNPGRALKQSSYNHLLITGLLFVLLVSFSIVVNHRADHIRDWYEVAKYLKFGVLLSGFYQGFAFGKYSRMLIWVMTLLIAFNLAHYLNLYGFNQFIEPWYASSTHLDLFGVDSLGQPSTRRALGTMGNPNMNGQLFVWLTFLMLAIGRCLRHPLLQLLTFAMITGVVMSQSRTANATLVVLLVIYFLTAKQNRSWAMLWFSGLAGLWLLFDHFGNQYLASVGSAALMQSASEGRVQQWLRIIETMPGHYLFGHGPAKEYFEANAIFSESELFLLLFRYGIAGTVCFVGAWFLVLLRARKKMGNDVFLIMAPVAIWAVSAITSNPMHSNKLSVVIAFALAFVFSLTNGRQSSNKACGGRA